MGAGAAGPAARREEGEYSAYLTDEQRSRRAGSARFGDGRLFPRAARLVVALAVATLGPASVGARPRLLSFDCEIGDGRKHVLVPRAEEDKSDDELRCRAAVAGLPASGSAEVAGELRLRTSAGKIRVVASGMFEREGQRAVLDELIVPHETWAPAVTWLSNRRPRLVLVFHVFTRPPEGQRRWQRLLTHRLELGGPPRAKGR